MTTQLIQVCSPYVTAGIVVKDGLITDAAPILRKAWLGRPFGSLQAWARREGWEIIVVEEMNAEWNRA